MKRIFRLALFPIIFVGQVAGAADVQPSCSPEQVMEGLFGEAVTTRHKPEIHQWRLRLRSAIWLVDSEANHLMMDFQAKWLSAAVAVQPSGVVVANRFSELQISLSDHQASEGVREGLAQQLREPFFFVAAPEGSIKEIRLPRAMNSQAQSTVKSIVATMQLVLPEGCHKKWEAEEDDVSGRCRVHYRRVNARRVHKEKVGYQFLDIGTGFVNPNPASMEIITSSVDFLLSSQNEPVEIRSIEHLRLSGLEMFPTLESRTEITVRRIDQHPRREEVVAFPDWTRYAASSLHSGPSEAARTADLDRVKIAGRGLQDLLTALGSSGGNQRRTRVALVALLRSDSDARRQAVAHIGQRGSHSGRLITALSYGNTPETREALRRLLEATSPSDPHYDILARALNIARQRSPD